jgi:hypothetical protein
MSPGDLVSSRRAATPARNQRGPSITIDLCSGPDKDARNRARGQGCSRGNSPLSSASEGITAPSGAGPLSAGIRLPGLPLSDESQASSR